MKNFFAFKISIFLLAPLLLFSCKKKVQEEAVQPEIIMEEKAQNHKWFYFSLAGIEKIDLPQNVPVMLSLPWTEAVRIASANNAYDSEVQTKAFAIVNRLGVLCFEGENYTLAKDLTIFNDRTAGNLVFLNNVPVFSVYKSAFFNDTISDLDYKTDSSLHLFLIQFDDVAKISYPLVNCDNLSDVPNTEVIDSTWDGLNWICSLKSISEEFGKTDFSYINWHPNVPLLSLSPITANGSIVVTESSKDAFREAKAQLEYKSAPERVKKLLAGFSTKIPFTLTVKSAGGTSARVYANQIADSEKQELLATAIISKSWSAALFEDGTMFIEGALPGKHILRGGKPVAIRLPKLPAGFVYSDFVISGTTLYAAWEETSFYKTSRSGFLSVDLDKTLYSKLR